MSRQSPVSEVMTTDVLTFGPDDNVAEAMQVLVERGIDGAPVVDADGAVVGMLSTADLIVQESRLHFPTVISLLGATLELPSAKRHFDDDLRRVLGSTVREVMQADPITIGVDDTVEEAATLLHDHDVSRLPVVGDAGLVGIVARVDILRGILRDDDEG
ncbi:MAG: CBS domain-containing protein [Actinobacteria bacterium]|nr:CBS domain-containing protein [Actinomycetota bacterium]